MGSDSYLDRRIRLAYWRLIQTTLAPTEERLKQTFDEVEREFRSAQELDEGETMPGQYRCPECGIKRMKSADSPRCRTCSHQRMEAINAENTANSAVQERDPRDPSASHEA